MTPAQKNELKAAIEEQITELQASIPSLEEAAQPVSPDASLGRLTRQDAMQAQQLNKNSLAKARKRLSQLKQALDRLDSDPDFGICRDCEEAIPAKRLLLLPESRTCVRCSSG